MFINNNPTTSNAPVTQITRDPRRNAVEQNFRWVRPTPERIIGLPGYCPCPPSFDHRAIISQLQSLISILSDLLRRIGGKPVNPVQPKPPSPIQVRPVPAELQRFVGMPVRDAEAQARREGTTNIRIIHPNQMITADAQMNRLNLYVNEAGMVTRAYWF
jgi:hypothetical protein